MTLTFYPGEKLIDVIIRMASTDAKDFFMYVDNSQPEEFLIDE